MEMSSQGSRSCDSLVGPVGFVPSPITSESPEMRKQQKEGIQGS